MAKENKNINDTEFDELLRKSFLEDEHSKFSDDLSKFVFDQEYDVKINPKKERDLINRFSGGHFIGSGLFYIVSSVIVVVIISIIILNFNIRKTEKPEVKNKTLILNYTNYNNDDSILKLRQFNDTNIYKQINEGEKKRFVEKSRMIKKELKSLILLSDTTKFLGEKQILATDLNKNEVFVLNTDFIQHYWNIKKMMIEKLINNDSKLYNSISPGIVNYKGENSGVSAFHIRRCPITNLEYRTFLIDLLVQGRKSDYDKAKVKSEIWNNYKMPFLAENYFKNEDYNDFPVVNISQEGAKLFCSWFESEAKLYAKKVNKNINNFKLRLPFDTEWMVLAKYGYTLFANNKGYLTIFDINEGYIDKSLEKQIKKLIKRSKSKSIVDSLWAINRYGISESKVLELLNKGFDIYNPKPADTIYPKRMMDYTAIGSVSEMTYEKQSGKSIVFGTSWKNKEEFTEMMTGFTKSSGSPFVGMRIVMIYDNAPEYTNPFW